MDPIAIEPAIVVEPIDQTSALFDLTDWLRVQFPNAITPLDGLADQAKLPVIEW